MKYTKNILVENCKIKGLPKVLPQQNNITKLKIPKKW